MNEDVLKLRVGIFVVIAMLILGILIFLNSEGWTKQYSLYVKPQTAPGVTIGTPIRKNGILIGRVESVSNEDDHVLLGLAINEKERIFANEIVSIGAESFLGDAVVEILPQPINQRGPEVGEDFVLGKVSVKRNPMEIVDVALNLETEITDTLSAIRIAGAAVNDAGVGVKNLTDMVQGAIGDNDSEFRRLLVEFRTMSVKAQAALDNFNRMFENLNNVVGDPELKEQFRDVIATLPEIFKEVRTTVTDTRETINSFRAVSKSANTNLSNLETFTGSLKENGPEILAQVKGSMENVNGLVTRIKTFTESLKKLQNTEGTLGKLINDRELYDTVMQTVDNVRDLSIKLEPMVNDLRMFSDSIARDPGVLGVRGALDRRPSKTGYKGNAVGRGNQSPLLR